MAATGFQWPQRLRQGRWGIAQQPMVGSSFQGLLGGSRARLAVSPSMRSATPSDMDPGAQRSRRLKGAGQGFRMLLPDYDLRSRHAHAFRMNLAAASAAVNLTMSMFYPLLSGRTDINYKMAPVCQGLRSIINTYSCPGFPLTRHAGFDMIAGLSPWQGDAESLVDAINTFVAGYVAVATSVFPDRLLLKLCTDAEP